MPEPRGVRRWLLLRKMRWAVRTLAGWPTARRRMFQHDRRWMRQTRRA